MAIVIEDGSNVQGANSFVTVDDLEAYMADRGFVTTANLEPMLIKAMDYLKSKEDQFQGVRNYYNQKLPFPRIGMYLYSDEFPANAIPDAVKEAQMAAATEVAKGVDLMPTVAGKFVKRKKVGPIETEYSETVGFGGQPQLTAIESILSILFGATSGAFLTLRRV